MLFRCRAPSMLSLLHATILRRLPMRFSFFMCVSYYQVVSVISLAKRGGCDPWHQSCQSRKSNRHAGQRRVYHSLHSRNGCHNKVCIISYESRSQVVCTKAPSWQTTTSWPSKRTSRRNVHLGLLALKSKQVRLHRYGRYAVIVLMSQENNRPGACSGRK